MRTVVLVGLLCLASTVLARPSAEVKPKLKVVEVRDYRNKRGDVLRRRVVLRPDHDLDTPEASWDRVLALTAARGWTVEPPRDGSAPESLTQNRFLKDRGQRVRKDGSQVWTFVPATRPRDRKVHTIARWRDKAWTRIMRPAEAVAADVVADLPSSFDGLRAAEPVGDALDQLDTVELTVDKIRVRGGRIPVAAPGEGSVDVEAADVVRALSTGRPVRIGGKLIEPDGDGSVRVTALAPDGVETRLRLPAGVLAKAGVTARGVAPRGSRFPRLVADPGEPSDRGTRLISRPTRRGNRVTFRYRKNGELRSDSVEVADLVPLLERHAALGEMVSREVGDRRLTVIGGDVIVEQVGEADERAGVVLTRRQLAYVGVDADSDPDESWSEDHVSYRFGFASPVGDGKSFRVTAVTSAGGSATLNLNVDRVRTALAGGRARLGRAVYRKVGGGVEVSFAGIRDVAGHDHTAILTLGPADLARLGL